MSSCSNTFSVSLACLCAGGFRVRWTSSTCWRSCRSTFRSVSTALATAPSRSRTCVALSRSSASCESCGYWSWRATPPACSLSDTLCTAATRCAHPSGRQCDNSNGKQWKRRNFAGCVGVHVTVFSWMITIGWRHRSVVRTSVFGWRIFPDLRLIYLWRTISWVKCPLWVNQPGQLSLPSLRGR